MLRLLKKPSVLVGLGLVLLLFLAVFWPKSASVDTAVVDWITSINRLELHGMIFHDELSARFVRRWSSAHESDDRLDHERISRRAEPRWTQRGRSRRPRSRPPGS